MTEKPKVKVQIEWGDVKHTVEGDLESVVREVMQFAAKVLPNYTLASKLTFSPDYSSMVDDLSESVKLPISLQRGGPAPQRLGRRRHGDLLRSCLHRSSNTPAVPVSC